MTWSDSLELNSAAYQIAASDNRYIRVIAGPGTGKSFAMKRRVARLLEVGIQARSILPVTFTRVAAEDLHRELVGLNTPGCENLEGTTLHSLALRILMRNHVLSATGRTPRPLNDFEIASLEADMASQYGGVRELRKKMKAYESGWARLQHDEPGYAQSPDDAAFERSLVAWLNFHEAMLIGEAIPQLYQYLSSNPLAQERTEFSHILVDEYQDLNKAEQGVITLLSGDSHICIVGDDDQSIYSFKHAHPEGIRTWHLGRPTPDDVTLGDCRRCPARVVNMANSLISFNASRPVQRALTAVPANGEGVVRIIQYSTLDREVNGILQEVFGMIERGVQPGDILILAQRGAIGTPIYEGLKGYNIPVRSYYAEVELDAEDAQRRFALLKLFVSRDDRVALRWLLGLGSSNWLAPSYARVRDYCEQNGAAVWETLERIAGGEISLPHTRNLVERFSQIKTEITQLEDIVSLLDLRAIVEHLFPDNDPGVRDIRALALETLDKIGGDDRELFLNELSSAIAKPEIPSEIEEVRIMSLHKSKGLSAAVTIIAGCVEGLLPKQPDSDLPAVEQAAQLEEQRRLFYVGITRVKASPNQGKPGTLILTYSQRIPFAQAMGAGIQFTSSSNGTANLIASRFIRELGPSAPTPESGT